MHVEAGDADHEARAAEHFAFRLVMIAQHVADVLAEKTLDALAKFLNAIHFLLGHAPGAVRSVGRTRREGRNLFVDLVVPGNIRHQILDEWKRLHRLQRDRLRGGYGIHARHAHEPRFAVDFRRAGAALAGLAIPAAGQIPGLGGLNRVHAIEYDRAFAVFD